CREIEAIEQESAQCVVVCSDVDEAQPVRDTGANLDRSGWRSPVQGKRLTFAGQQHAVESDDDDVIGGGVVAFAGLENEKRPVQAPSKLCFIMPVGVVDERPCPRRCESGLEGSPRSYRWRKLVALTAIARDPIEVAVELDTMPVHRGRYRQPVH